MHAGILLLVLCAIGLAPVECMKAFGKPLKLPPKASLDTTGNFGLQKIISELVMKENEIDLENFLLEEYARLKTLEEEVRSRDISNSCDSYEQQLVLFQSIAKALDYSKNGMDPFSQRKFAALTSKSCTQYIHEISNKIVDFLDEDELEETLRSVLLLALWGTRDPEYPFQFQLGKTESENENMVSIKTRRKSFDKSIGISRRQILNNEGDLEDVVNLLIKMKDNRNVVAGKSRSNPSRIDIVIDQVGHGLVADLLLAHVLITNNICDIVRFHTRAYPCGIYGATIIDITGHIEQMADPQKANDIWSVHHFGDALRQHVFKGNFEFVDDSFWCDFTPFWDMPDHIQERLAGSKLVFVKGDANYRRLLGERQWPLDTLAADVLSYWPVPVCALRTFKAEIGCGVSVEAQSRAERDDANWKVSGKWGVVQVGGDISGI